MFSYQAFTDEIDDLDLAVEQLAKQVEAFNLSSNTGGIVYCGSEVDTYELCKKTVGQTSLPFYRNDLSRTVYKRRLPRSLYMSESFYRRRYFLQRRHDR